jgi:Uncharacterised protein family (UPF0236)
MSAITNPLMELEKQAAEEGRCYGRERLRERLQQIADQQGSVSPRSSLRLKDACFRDLPLETTLGRVSIRAHYGYDPQSQRWMFPVKELWDLSAHQEVSPYLEQLVSHTATECGSYQKAQQMAGHWGVKISATSIHKHVQRLGAKAQQQEQTRAQRALDAATRPEVARQAQAQAPNALPKYSLVISMDAWKVRERGPDWALKPPEAPGQRVDWKDLKLAILYRLDQLVAKAPPQTDPTAKPRRQILQKFWVATPSNTPPEEFGRLVHAEALRRGMAQAQYVFLVCDGALWIWNIIADRFVGALSELDFYHASQHLWEVAHDLYSQPEAAREWVEPLLHQLRHGQEAEVLGTLKKLPEQVRTLGGAVSELLEREIKYFNTHRDHIHYQDNAAKGFPEGSGAVESACSQFEDRFQRTGQFWKSESLGHLQSLKVARQDGDWEELCQLPSPVAPPSIRS